MPSTEPNTARREAADVRQAPRRAVREIRRAERLAQSGKVSEAIASLHEAVRCGADRYTCLLRIARLHESRRQWSEAVCAAEEAIAEDPNRLSAREAMITFLMEARDYAGAANASKALLKLSPRHVPARDALGAAYLGMGDIHSAMRTIQELIRLDPNSPGPRFTKAHLAQSCGDVPTAVEEFGRVVALAPEGELAQAALQQLEILDSQQLGCIAMLAAEDAIFRARLQDDPDEAPGERGFLLSDTGREALREYVATDLPELEAPPRPSMYH